MSSRLTKKDLRKLTKKQLIRFCKKRNLSPKGSKTDIVDRLLGKEEPINTPNRITKSNNDYIVLLINAYFRGFFPHNIKESHYCPTDLVTLLYKYIEDVYIIFDKCDKLNSLPIDNYKSDSKKNNGRYIQTGLDYLKPNSLSRSYFNCRWYSSKKLSKGVHCFKLKILSKIWNDTLIGITECKYVDHKLSYNKHGQLTSTQKKGNRYYVSKYGIISNEFFGYTPSGMNYTFKIKNKLLTHKVNDIISINLNCDSSPGIVTFKINEITIKSLRIVKGIYTPIIHVGCDNLKLELISYNISQWC